ncbi:hypothetical protein [Janthinobacterium sp. HLS12-2]|uniref:hypothetical protein n=1 Tax=Janthinobacterium sp. HLS12-2 TaxID=1259324 RepID=UPI003F2029B6
MASFPVKRSAPANVNKNYSHFNRVFGFHAIVALAEIPTNSKVGEPPGSAAQDRQGRAMG